MTIRKQGDSGFDDFRKERKRIQAKVGRTSSAQDYDNHALRELEQAEEREVRDQQLTREVHDFFAAATRQAASIVDRVARDAERQAGERVEQEMESFLIDSLARMNSFVLTVLKERRGSVAETRKEPSIGNLVGTLLDEFRNAGTADVGDKHIGQDPFATPVDDVQREFRQQVGTSPTDTDGARPIDQHLVAAVVSEEPAPAADAAPALPEVTARTRATANEPPATDATGLPSDELDRLKEALKSMVRQGLMTRDEAKAAWQVRLQALATKA